MPKIPGGLSDVSTDNPVLPDSTYPVTITEMEFKRAGTGAQMFAMVSEVREGDSKGFHLYENIVIINKDGERNEAGLRRLKKVIEQLVGKEAANNDDFDTDELIGIDAEAVVTIKSRPDPDDSEKQIPENRIKRFVR